MEFLVNLGESKERPAALLRASPRSAYLSSTATLHTPSTQSGDVRSSTPSAANDSPLDLDRVEIDQDVRGVSYEAASSGSGSGGVRGADGLTSVQRAKTERGRRETGGGRQNRTPLSLLRAALVSQLLRKEQNDRLTVQAETSAQYTTPWRREETIALSHTHSPGATSTLRGPVDWTEPTTERRAVSHTHAPLTHAPLTDARLTRASLTPTPRGSASRQSVLSDFALPSLPYAIRIDVESPSQARSPYVTIVSRTSPVSSTPPLSRHSSLRTTRQSSALHVPDAYDIGRNDNIGRVPISRGQRSRSFAQQLPSQSSFGENNYHPLPPYATLNLRPKRQASSTHTEAGTASREGFREGFQTWENPKANRDDVSFGRLVTSIGLGLGPSRTPQTPTVPAPPHFAHARLQPRLQTGTQAQATPLVALRLNAATPSAVNAEGSARRTFALPGTGVAGASVMRAVKTPIGLGNGSVTTGVPARAPAARAIASTGVPLTRLFPAAKAFAAPVALAQTAVGGRAAAAATTSRPSANRQAASTPAVAGARPVKSPRDEARKSVPVDVARRSLSRFRSKPFSQDPSSSLPSESDPVATSKPTPIPIPIPTPFPSRIPPLIPSTKREAQVDAFRRFSTWLAKSAQPSSTATERSAEGDSRRPVESLPVGSLPAWTSPPSSDRSESCSSLEKPQVQAESTSASPGPSSPSSMSKSPEDDFPSPESSNSVQSLTPSGTPSRSAGDEVEDEHPPSHRSPSPYTIHDSGVNVTETEERPPSKKSGLSEICSTDYRRESVGLALPMQGTRFEEPERNDIGLSSADLRIESGEPKEATVSEATAWSERAAVRGRQESGETRSVSPSSTESRRESGMWLRLGRVADEAEAACALPTPRAESTSLPSLVCGWLETGKSAQTARSTARPATREGEPVTEIENELEHEKGEGRRTDREKRGGTDMETKSTSYGKSAKPAVKPAALEETQTLLSFADENLSAIANTSGNGSSEERRAVMEIRKKNELMPKAPHVRRPLREAVTECVIMQRCLRVRRPSTALGVASLAIKSDGGDGHRVTSAKAKAFKNGIVKEGQRGIYQVQVGAICQW